MRRKAILVFWLFGILFPMGWFVHLSSQSGRLFEEVFQPQWTHVVMHTVLYAVLACLLAYQLADRGGRASSMRFVANTLALVMVVAIVQEAIQLFYQVRLPGYDELFDVGVDLVGAGLGLIVFLGVFTRPRFSLHSRDHIVG